MIMVDIRSECFICDLFTVRIYVLILLYMRILEPGDFID